MFITTKLWNSDQGRDSALRAFERSLERLGLERVDLYLIHWPVPSADKYAETWQALTELQADGRAHSIGVSNFGVDHLERIIEESGVVPAVNQIELHPRLQQRELRGFHEQRGILTEAWSPLGPGEILDDPAIGRVRPRPHPGSDRSPLAPPDRQRGDPEVGDPRADRGELPDLGVRARRRRAARDRGSRSGGCIGPGPATFAVA